MSEIDELQRSASIYCLVDPRTRQIRYVGRTTTSLLDRLAGHLRELRYTNAVNKGLMTWLRELAHAELKPEIRLLETIHGDDKVSERRWIEKMFTEGVNLTNVHWKPSVSSR